ncbi:hypothetical protein [Psychrobacter sp. I-STPA10]|uniref:hypothetical protein n=1 Tax=Psychrobacter sp. I-STPA10 TaxID=2585769 RepID=UPI001E2D4EF2|nr:hypothetical protein [Psychrobacter sp. I-STPA10]
MCYELVLSTDAPLDLTTLNTAMVFFEPSDDERYVHNVKHQYKYRIATGAPNSCSCDLCIVLYDSKNHITQELKQWINDDIEIKNTHWLFDVIKKLINDGYQVDSYVDMDGDKSKEKQTVYINNINKENFAFVDGVYYDYQP